MLIKAADYLTISNRKENDVSLKKLKERIEEMEAQKLEMKSEHN